jgi:hypothetical protein
VLFSSQEDAHLLSWARAVERFITLTHTHPLYLALDLQCYYTFAEIGGDIDLGYLRLCPGQFKLAYLLAFDILGVGCCSFVRVSSLVRLEMIPIRLVLEFGAAALSGECLSSRGVSKLIKRGGCR